MQVKLQLLACGFAEDQKTGNLNTAACTSCAGSHKHQDHKYGLGKYRPHVKIRSCISGCGNNGTNLEGCLLERPAEAGKHASCVNGNGHNGQANNPKVIANLLILGCLHYFLGKKKVIGIKIHSKKDHKHGNDNLIVGTVAGNTVVLNTKASGTCCTKAQAQCIEQRHASKKQEDHLHNCHQNINGIKNLGCGLNLGNQLAYRRSRALCFHQVHVVASGQRQKAKDKHQHSHTPDPVGKASPQQDTVGK